jgi:hypothetical protein
MLFILEISVLQLNLMFIPFNPEISQKINKHPNLSFVQEELQYRGSFKIFLQALSPLLSFYDLFLSL